MKVKTQRGSYASTVYGGLLRTGASATVCMALINAPLRSEAPAETPRYAASRTADLNTNDKAKLRFMFDQLVGLFDISETIDILAGCPLERAVHRIKSMDDRSASDIVKAISAHDSGTDKERLIFIAEKLAEAVKMDKDYSLPFHIGKPLELVRDRIRILEDKRAHDVIGRIENTIKVQDQSPYISEKEKQ